jgi:hypothetical protein
MDAINAQYKTFSRGTKPRSVTVVTPQSRTCNDPVAEFDNISRKQSATVGASQTHGAV